MGHATRTLAFLFTAIPAAAAWAAPQPATTLDFDGLAGAGEFTGYTAQGFQVTKTSGLSGCMAGEGTERWVWGGTPCDGKKNGHFRVGAATPFVFDAIDVAAADGDLDVQLEGLLAGETLWAMRVAVADSASRFATVFGASPAAIDTLRLSLHAERGARFAIDNIALSPQLATGPGPSNAVAEPASAALAGSALAALALMRRRKTR